MNNDIDKWVILNLEVAPKSTEIQANWYDAKLYCFSLNIDGKTGWRLPTKEELNEIYESVNDFVHGNYYWTSPDYNGPNAWVQIMSNGFQNDSYKSYSAYVRAVRDI